jgi:hypothetical protein
MVNAAPGRLLKDIFLVLLLGENIKPRLDLFYNRILKHP